MLRLTFVPRIYLTFCVLAPFGACTGSIGGQVPSTTPAPTEPARPGVPGGSKPAPDVTNPDRPAANLASPFRRLLLAELEGALADVLALPIERVTQVTAALPPDLNAGAGFLAPRTFNGGYAEALASVVSELVVAASIEAIAPRFQSSCAAGRRAEAGCLREFVTEVGRKAFRRPLRSAEIGQLESFGVRLRSDVPDTTEDEVLRALLSLLLQSPEFLYLGTDAASSPGRVSLPDHQVAERLSFFLWSQPPDAELARAADEGRLSDPQVRAAQTRRLLADARAASLHRRFFGQLLGADDLAQVERAAAADGATLTPALRTAMRDETLALVQHLFRDNNGAFSEMFSSPVALTNATLARHHGQPAPQGEDFVVRKDSARPTAGLLTTSAFLVSVAGHDSPSPTHFGVAVRDRFLCDKLAPPPVGVDTRLPPLETSPTLRARSEIHVKAPSCAACHKFLDPIGFASLGFDHLGRTSARGEDTSGVVAGMDGEADRSFADVVELGRILAATPRARTCFATKWLAFASGRAWSTEAPLPAFAADAFASRPRAGDVAELFLATAASELFRTLEIPPN